MGRKSGCQKIQEMADKKDEERIKACPTRYALHKKEQREKRVASVKKGAGIFFNSAAKVGKSLLDVADRATGGKPAKRTQHRTQKPASRKSLIFRG